VTTTKAAGYPECEAVTAHPLAWLSKRCEGGAEYVGQTSDSESGGNALLYEASPLLDSIRDLPQARKFQLTLAQLSISMFEY
jgi:hypothetical protein